MATRLQRRQQQQQQQPYEYDDQDEFGDFQFEEERENFEHSGRGMMTGRGSIKDKGDDYYMEIYYNFERQHPNDMDSAIHSFEEWCWNHGVPEDRLSNLINMVQFGPMDEEFTSENFEKDIEKRIVCFSAAFTLDELAKQGQIELKPDKNFLKVIQDENPVVVNVSHPFEATNGSFTSVLISAGSSSEVKGKTVIKKSEASPYPLIARLSHSSNNEKIGSLLNTTNDPITIKNASYTDTQSVLKGCTKTEKGERVTYTVGEDHEDLYSLIEQMAPDTPMTPDDFSFILTEKQAKKYANILVKSTDDTLKCKASQLRIFAEPAHDIYEESEEKKTQSAKGKGVTKFMGRNVGQETDEVTKQLSKLITSNAGMVNPLSKSNSRSISDITKITGTPCAVTIKAEVWTVKKKEKMQNDKKLLSRPIEDITSSEEE
jgi:hypothetical protein